MSKRLIEIAKSELTQDEKIIKHFLSADLTSIINEINVGVISPAATAMPVDFSFRYEVVVTDSRIFIGQINYLKEILSYKVYDKSEVKDVSLIKYKDVKKGAGLNFYYGVGLFAIFFCSIGLLNLKYNLTSTRSIDSIPFFIGTIIIPPLIVFLCYKLFNKVVNTKLLAKINFKSNNSIILLLDEKKTLDLLG